jgi:hypothetical protein
MTAGLRAYVVDDEPGPLARGSSFAFTGAPS